MEKAEMSKEEILEEASGLIKGAAMMIAPLGEEFERVSWMLEDAVIYLSQAEERQDAAWSKERETRTLENIERLVETVTSVNTNSSS